MIVIRGVDRPGVGLHQKGSEATNTLCNGDRDFVFVANDEEGADDEGPPVIPGSCPPCRCSERADEEERGREPRRSFIRKMSEATSRLIGTTSEVHAPPEIEVGDGVVGLVGETGTRSIL